MASHRCHKWTTALFVAWSRF